MDLLQGSIWNKVLAFALPLMATSMLQQFFNAADIAVVGQFVGKQAMAAVGSNSPVVGLTINLFMGISIGSNVVLARYTGQNMPDKISRAVHSSIVLAVILGVAIAILGELIAVPLLGLLGVPDDIYPMALKYLRIYFAGMPFVTLFNFESAIFRSQGDTRTPLITLSIAGVFNVAFNVFFVLVCGMDVEGVAIATVISNAVNTALLYRFLRKSDSEIRIDLTKLGLDKPIVKTILRIGVPSGVQGMVFSISNIVVQSAINSLGSDVIAGSAAAFNIEILGFFVLNSFGQACITFIGQNHGAGLKERCIRIVRVTLAMDVLFVGALAITLFVFGDELLLLFTKDPAVIAFGFTRIKVLMSAEVVNAVIEVLSGAMRGYGYSLVPAVVALVGICGTRIVWVFTYFAAHPTWNTLVLVYPISWIITAIVMVFGYYRVRKKALGM